ncbi:MAG: sugar ABC transporter permease [Verrucomicrobiota bacterium]
MSYSLSRKKALLEWRLYLFILPSILLVGLFCYYPAINAIYHSFFDWQGGDFKQFVGLDNFRRAWNDPTLLHSFGTVFILILANMVKMIPSIFTAVMVHRLTCEKWQYVYRVLLVLPMIIPSMVTLFIWKFFFDPNLGVLNHFLNRTGLQTVLIHLDHFCGWGGVFQTGVPTAWLSTPTLIIPSLILWGFPWIGAIGVLIFLSGLQSIGAEVYEAAELDGVNSFQKFLYIEFPLLMTQVRISLVLMVIGTLRDFYLQFLLLGENGGAGGKGMVPGLWMYNRAFVAGEFGYACAIGIILFGFILILTFIQNKYVRVEK